MPSKAKLAVPRSFGCVAIDIADLAKGRPTEWHEWHLKYARAALVVARAAKMQAAYPTKGSEGQLRYVKQRLTALMSLEPKVE